MTATTDPAVSSLLAETVTAPALALAVEGRADGVPALAQLSRVGRRLVARQVAAELGQVLDVDLQRVAEKAWSVHDRLVAAGYRTASTGGQEVVEVGRHTITSTHRPTVDVVVNDAVVATVTFGLTLALDVASLVAVVRAGHLVGAHPGPCTLTASLSCEGVPLPSATAKVRLPGSVDLGDGHRLVPESFAAPDVTLPGPRVDAPEPDRRAHGR